MTTAGTRLGRALGTAAHRTGLARPVVRLAARILRRLDPGHPALAPAPPTRPEPILGVVPDQPPSAASGRADLQLVHRLDEGHAGPADPHTCHCDSWLLPPQQRARPHPCRCPLPEEEGSHLPPGGPPFVTPGKGGH